MQDPQNQEPQDQETRLNRAREDDSNETNEQFEQTPPPAGSFGDTGEGFDDSRSRDVDYGYTGSSMSGGMSQHGEISPSDEKTWSTLSHLSLLANFVTGIGGFVAALVIWLVYKDRSPRIGFHALQSLWYQVAWAGIFIGFGVVSTVLGIITFGLAAVVLVPLALLLAFVPVVHQCYAAYKVSQGVDYRYPIIADMIDGERRFR
jgi:uncharacterized Tic20 family protein